MLMLLIVLCFVPVQLFLFSRDQVLLALLASHDGSTMDYVFRRIWNSITALQLVGAWATLVVMRTLAKGMACGSAGAATLCTLAATVAVAGLIARVYLLGLLFRGGVTVFVIDFMVTCLGVGVYVLSRRCLCFHSSINRTDV